MSPSFVSIAWAGRPVRIEHAFVGVDDARAPLVVFLHEGLGSLAMWKDFPQQLCAAAGLRGLVYSRPGYGRSTPRAPEERWLQDFMHRQAFEVLPALLQALHITQPYALFGHSDGGSISLLHAARFGAQVSRAIVLAPHILVEDLSVASIEQARSAYEQGGLKSGLAKYHDDPDSAFWGWNGIWLDPAFRAWDIQAEIGSIRCPLLAVQGLDDVYGTLEQIRGIQRRVPHTRLLELAQCGHSPHRDQPAALIEAAKAFFSTPGSHGDTP
ncbi:alpha/beta fold hydrolase [Rubrivivax rivuli]|uniref:Alpha/beta hydrolase n=1 Tax=Rubrivivax rivuli TaxID=1862385 RepID=A0A437RE98_9BURK|nr:alpha/beta hydrolase [Rubrivivax rivuli]RVU45032.1 alpha/beta hydrolase [Rubrivivax rivuli]